MKMRILKFLLITSVLSIEALHAQQYSISAHSNLSTYSLHHDLLFSTQIKQHKLTLGLKFNDGVLPRGPAANNLQLWPQSFMEVFGVKLGYQYILKANWYIRPYIFLNSEFTKCSWFDYTIGELSSEYVLIPLPGYTYYGSPGKMIAGPNRVFDERLGVGFYAPVTDKIDFDIYCGAGWLFQMEDPPGPKSNVIISTTGGSFGLNAGIGLSYKFGKKEVDMN